MSDGLHPADAHFPLLTAKIAYTDYFRRSVQYLSKIRGD